MSRGLLVMAVVGALAAGCARKLPPTGGPPDLHPPALVAAEPESGAVAVPADVTVRLRFSEAMDRASVTQSVLLGPGVRDAEFRWEGGRMLAIRPAEPLAAGRTFVLILGAGARDLRGNPLERTARVHFTTADTFPAGAIAGRVEGRGVAPEGVYVWAYREDLGRAPDSTAFDMDGLARAEEGGSFVLPGLPVPGVYRLYSFVDRNRNRSFEPGPDLLERGDSLVTLTAEAPRAAGVRVLAVDPEALARVEGAVLDSLAPGAEPLYVEARGVPADSAVAADRVPIVVLDVLNGRFLGNLRAGRWRLTAFRDVDRNRTLGPAEPRSQAVEIDLVPGGSASNLSLALAPPGSPP